MDRGRFTALVARLEEAAQRDPRGYRLRVALLAAAGFAYLAFVLTLLAALTLLAIASIVVLKVLGVKVAIVIGAFLWVVLRALWVKLEPPRGVEVTRREAPLLHERIEALRRQLDAPRFHHVLVTNDFNASVVQVARLGIFGWHRNYLTIGLPLMKSLTPEQLEAVLAHELGHLARGHGRFSNWIYRLRIGWHRLLLVLEETQSAGLFLFKPFFARYEPYFSAYTFPLARANEYEADAASARLTSRRAAAEALTASEVIGAYLQERYWPGIYRETHDAPRPAFLPYSGMGERLREGISEEDRRQWLARAMAAETTVANTHPSLADRLKALGEVPRHAPPAEGGAADQWLGDALPAITKFFDDTWQAAVAPAWEARHREVQAGRVRLAEYAARDPRSLTTDERLEHALLVEDIGADAPAALALYRAAYDADPAHAAANFALGLRLLQRDDAAGVPLVERAMALDPDAQVAATQAIRDFLARQGRREEADAWHDRLVAAQLAQQAYQRERNTIHTRDRLEPHGLEGPVLEDIRARLKAIPEIHKAWLARKVVKQRPDAPMFILAFRAARWWRFGDKRRVAAVLARIQQEVPLPGNGLILALDGENASFGSKFKRRWRVA